MPQAPGSLLHYLRPAEEGVDLALVRFNRRRDCPFPTGFSQDGWASASLEKTIMKRYGRAVIPVSCGEKRAPTA